MIACDALVVGGGPAGSTCARLLRRAGLKVVLMDRAAFPRDKVCGGWLTPEVFPLLDLDPDEYRAAGLTLQNITGFRTGVLRRAAVDTAYGSVVSYAIRRCEFDDFLLRRADVQVLQQTPLSSLRRENETWIANDCVRSQLVIGAGGHFCPVARRLRKRTPAAAPVVAKEAEFQLDRDGTTVAAHVPELFFCHDLEGYAWCVRKGDMVNVGIGRRHSAGFGTHVDDFIAYLEATGKAPGASRARWHGHAYFASGIGARAVADDGVMLIGDAAGLAYPESGEGIKPAIDSAIAAARTVLAAKGRCTRADFLPYEEAIRRQHPPPRRSLPVVRSLEAAVGRALLSSPTFVRHVVLDRWFLRRNQRSENAPSPFGTKTPA